MKTQKSEESRLLTLIQMSLACTSYGHSSNFSSLQACVGCLVWKFFVVLGQCLAGQFWLAACFCNVTSVPSHPHLLHVVYGCFHATTAKLSIAIAESWAVWATALKILTLRPLQKVLLTSNLRHFFLVPPLAHLRGGKERNSGNIP